MREGSRIPIRVKRENDQPSIFFDGCGFPFFFLVCFLFLLCKGGDLGVGFVSSFSFLLAFNGLEEQSRNSVAVALVRRRAEKS